MTQARLKPSLIREIFLAVGLVALLSGCGGGSSSPSASAVSDPAQVALVPPVTDGVGVSPATTPVVTTPVITAPVTPVSPVVAPTPVAVPTPSSAVTAVNSCSLPGFQVEIMRSVNAARAVARSCGTQAKPAVAGLAWNDILFAASASHSQDMAVRNYFSHTSPEGTTSAQRAVLAGYRYQALGENIAAGQRSIETVMQGWIASEGHCNNIMNSSFTEIAVACVATSRPLYPTYWTMVLGKPQ